MYNSIVKDNIEFLNVKVVKELINMKIEANKNTETIQNSEDKGLNIEHHKLFFIETWGCQMNEEDSEKLSGMLKLSGL